MNRGTANAVSATLVALAAGLGGAAGASIHFAAWTESHPESPADPTQFLLSEAPTSPAFQAAISLGAFVAFLVVGIILENPFTLIVLRASSRLVLLAVGGLVGAGVGCVSYVLLWAYGHEARSIVAVATEMGDAIATQNRLLFALLLAGAISGLAATLFLIGSTLMRSAARNVTGATLGGLAGLVMYSIAYVLTYYPTIPSSSSYMIHFAEAIYAFDPVEYLFVLLGVGVGLMMARYSWRLYGIFTLISLVSVVLGYLMYTTSVTFPSLPPGQRIPSLILFVAETFSLIMVVLYSFYTIDVATRKHWKRTPTAAHHSPYFMPKVAFQVPTFNEPPELVLGTLNALLRVDYPQDRFLIQVVDDSTDPASAGPLREFCEARGIAYLRRPQRTGYKAGALNHALKLCPPDVELIAIIDADYQVVPEFLREVVGFFVNPNLGWVQTPQDYRNRHQSFLTEQYYVADAYFYRSVLPSRNEENSIIFCGTMGILRRRALEDVGGWGESYITEDAELSIRLVNNGWGSLYINKTYGRGLIPATFEGYKKQHYRWAFGGGRILRGHLAEFVFGRFTGRQWYDYLLGNVHWFEGLFILIIASSVLAMGVGDLLGFRVATHHAEEIMLIGLVPMFLLVDGLTRLHMVLRRTLRLGMGGTIGVLGMWFSVKFSNAFGALKAFVGFSIPFVRTPKAPSDRLSGRQALRHAIRIARFESTMAALLLVTGLGLFAKILLTFDGPEGVVIPRVFLLFWILMYSLVFLAAPVYAYKSFVTFKPTPSVNTVTTVQGVPI
ncbi:MAG: glycosyltransferase [Euryarchaeota archaeon]|nr:glycosyltransferase [Euryarchaeota archaeon]